jgi:hypothetical protein
LSDVSKEEKIYDGMSYHQGSVWPLFTGWGALAEYRGGQPLAGYQMLMQNVQLTRAQDLGAATELLSGDFYIPFGRSTSHQLWSSAMVITPTLRGLFGIDIDAEKKVITVNPHLPAEWKHVEVLNLLLPGEVVSLYFERHDGILDVYLSPTQGDQWKLRTDISNSTYGPLGNSHLSGKLKSIALEGLRILLPELEVDSSTSAYADRVIAETKLMGRQPIPGAQTENLRIIKSEAGNHRLVLIAEGMAGSTGLLTLIRNGHFIPKVQDVQAKSSDSSKSDASISFRDCDANPYGCTSLPLILNFPPGEGWKTMTVTLSW